jgi:hypothetical protein
MAKRYVFQNEVKVELELVDGCLGLVSLEPLDPAEKLLVFGTNGENGEFACWDAGVEIKDESIGCIGMTRSHGQGDDVELAIPLAHVSGFNVAFTPLTPMTFD